MQDIDETSPLLKIDWQDFKYKAFVLAESSKIISLLFKLYLFRCIGSIVNVNICPEFIVWSMLLVITIWELASSVAVSVVPKFVPFDGFSESDVIVVEISSVT